MPYSTQVLDQIRSMLPVSVGAGQHVVLKKKGREYAGLSPFKPEKTPSFFVNDQKGFYHCFASGEHGDIFSLIMKIEGLSFDEAVEKLAKLASVTLPPRLNKVATPPTIGRPTNRNQAPSNWQNTYDFRLFISHLAEHSDKAVRLKSCLASYAVNGFVAHEDITPTLDWQGELERALRTADAFLAIHTPGFSRSIWTQQEVGFALGRGIKIISFKMGEDPTGFISKQQALSRKGKSAEQIASEVDSILSSDPETKSKLESAKAFRGLLDEIPF
jgi:hypothetical protein